ncbi:hypothetical protein ID866_364 [Astraeus odoratus]|nr:hypothetical protein ID866_364 [Astraeus odoratus]
MKFGDVLDTASVFKRDLSQIRFAKALVATVSTASELTLIIAFLYSGLSRRKSALSLIWVVSATNAVCIFQWYFWGYSLAFSPTATNGFIGNLDNFGLINVLGDPSPGSPLIPDLLYSFYQMEVACVTIGILIGAVAERGRVLPAMVFTFLWMTLVYCPLACWAWNVNGWGLKWGVLDFAGMSIFPAFVKGFEIGSGVGGIAYAWVLGRRRQEELHNFRPHSVAMITLGTFILWFGWLGFNGGSAYGANLRAVMAIWNSMIAPAFGGIVWCLIDYRSKRKYSMVGFCCGTIVGLIAATSASGYIPPLAAVFMGVFAGAVCNYATKIKEYLEIDDTFDIFAQHAVGGIIGLLFNGLFGSQAIIALDGVNTNVPGGWVDKNWKQLYIQLVYVCAGCVYTFVATVNIAKIINVIPGLQLRTPPDGESLGLDEVEASRVPLRYRYDWLSAPFF